MSKRNGPNASTDGTVKSRFEIWIVKMNNI